MAIGIGSLGSAEKFKAINESLFDKKDFDPKLDTSVITSKIRHLPIQMQPKNVDGQWANIDLPSGWS